MAARLLLALGGVALAVVLFFVLRPEGQEEATPAPVPTTVETTNGSTTATIEETTTGAGPPPPRIFRLTIRGGRPQGGVKQLRVDRGERVVLVVRSDLTDHVHVHGYDFMRDVAPGEPARLRFRATLTGRFEIELEDRHVLIAELEVRP
jgi:hypothetical protein